MIFARNLERRYSIACERPEWERVLGYLSCDPDVEGPAPEERALAVSAYKDRVWLEEAGVEGREFASVAEVRDHLHARFFMEALAGDRPVLHGACLVKAGRRVLLVGPKCAGKSTLSLRLALAGYQMEGDENVFISLAGVVARPRGCRVKEGSFTVLPELTALAGGEPFMVDYYGRRIYNVSPAVFGTPWRIAPGKVDAVVLLYANHGGMSSIRPVAPLDLTQAMMAETYLPPGKKRGAGIAAMSLLAARARGYDLSVGELEAAVACVDHVVLRE